MPELPEVETIRRDLVAFLVGKMISDVQVIDRRVVEGFGPGGRPRRRVRVADFVRTLVGRTVKDLHRRGKYLIFDLGSGPSLLAHLRMTGRLVLGPPDPRARARVIFTEGAPVLNFIDTRRFGELWLADNWHKDPAIAALGPEPLGEGIDPGPWGRQVRRSSAKIQAVLLDQKRIAGLGTIYVTEALFRSGIRPTRRASAVHPLEIPPLLGHVRDVLGEGLAHRGVSFRDYRDARGERGQAGERLRVYGKAGKSCPCCRTILRGTKVSGRGAVFCPQCQK
jgi:formamidopyrimidine-DNA glycosylase